MRTRYLISDFVFRWEKERNLPPKFVGEWVGLIFLVKKEMNDAKLRDKEDSRFEGEERYVT